MVLHGGSQCRLRRHRSACRLVGGAWEGHFHLMPQPKSVHTYLYLSIYLSIYIYIYMHTGTYTACTSQNICIYRHTYMHTFISIYIYTHIHITCRTCRHRKIVWTRKAIFQRRAAWQLLLGRFPRPGNDLQRWSFEVWT